MADKQSTVYKPRKKKNRNPRNTFYMGALIFILLTLYLVGYVLIFMTRPKVDVEVADYGSASTTKPVGAVIIRKEAVVLSNADGVASYYYGEEERVGKNTSVLSISDVEQTSVLANKIEALDADIWKMQENRADITIFKHDIERIDEKIKSIVGANSYKFINASIEDVYNFKTQIKKQMELKTDMLLTENKGSVKRKVEEKINYESQLKAAVTALKAPASGIVSFEIDGFETVFTVDNMKEITDEQVKMDIKKEPSIFNKPVVKDKPAFKVVTSNEWYMAAYIKNEQLNNMKEGNSYILVTESKGQKKEIAASIYYLRGGETESFVIFKTSQFMTDFLSTRKINVTINKEEVKGIQVPKTAIVEKNLYKIPKDFISASGTITMANSSTVSADVLMSEDDYRYVLVTAGSLKIGDEIINKNGGEMSKVTIQEIKLVRGVYVVNSSIAIFKTIGDTLYESGEYVIVASGGGLKVYDKIISDAKNTEDHQRIY